MEAIEQEANLLWDVEEPDRFVALATHHADLLTFGEQQLWKALISSELLSPAYHAEWGWNVEAFAVVFPKLRDRWSELMRVRASPSELREWVDRVRAEVASGKIYPKQKTRTEPEDEIPF